MAFEPEGPGEGGGVSVVVPVYRSEESLTPLVERLHDVLSATGRPFEVVLVDDFSPDGSWGVVRALAGRFPTVTGMTLMRNYGQHNALLCGVRAARHPIVVTMDDDLQHPPEAVPALLAALTPDVDVVYGAPARETHGVARDLASQLTKLVLRSVMGVEAARGVSAFRAFRTPLRRAFDAYQGAFVSIDVLLTWGTTRFRTLRVAHEPRRSGRSGYTVRKLVAHAVNMLTGFSVLPLQLASLVGFAFTLFGFGVLAYVLGRYLLQGVVVPGFAFLASIIAIFSGAQLFALGIMGEYLARMHFRLMSRPSYTVADTTPAAEVSPAAEVTPAGGARRGDG